VMPGKPTLGSPSSCGNGSLAECEGFPVPPRNPSTNAVSYLAGSTARTSAETVKAPEGAGASK
jgi:hypothetical protein